MAISDTGVILTPSATALAEAQGIITSTYGPTANIDASSPNGLLIQNIALAITQREVDQANTVNAMNPNIATGTQLDAICSNLDIYRNPATYSQATIAVTGLPGIVIPNGTQVSSTNNDTFLVSGAITIGVGGTATGTVVAQSGGPILVDANTIINILQGVNGWDTVNNPTSGTLGAVVQSDTGFRTVRTSKLASTASGSYNAVLAGAANLSPQPRSFYLTENYTGSPIIIDGVTIAANSILLVLDTTATAASIGQMLFEKLSAGCGMTGTSSYPYPIPNSAETFLAKWLVATNEQLVINITLKSGSPYPLVASIPADIASIINNNFNFNLIGQFIYANEFVTLLSANGYSPILNLTFNVGTNVNLTQFTMPINQTLLSISNPLTQVVLNYG